MEKLLSSWFLGRSSERRDPLPRSAYERREGGTMKECCLCGQVEWEHLDPAGEGYCKSLHPLTSDECSMCPTEEELERMRPKEELE